MKQITLKKLLLALLVITLFPVKILAAETNNTINQLVFFGDSLTDNGNLYTMDIGTYPKSPPYYQGRFSNGPTWAELVATHFLKTKNISSTNYAFGGETILSHNVNKGYWPTLLYQSIENYYIHSTFDNKNQTLYVMLIGANDYLWGSENPEKDTTDVVAGLKENLNNMISAGGKHFLILNIPNLSIIPAIRLGGDLETFKKLTQLHNAKLANLAKELKQSNPDVDVQVFDYYGLTENILAHPEIYNKKFNTHITNTTDACWTGGYQLSLSETNIPAPYATNPTLFVAYATAENASNGMKPCTDPDSYLFWDLVHPTSQGHLITSEMVIEYIEANFRV